jgi:phytoene synthase
VSARSELDAAGITDPALGASYQLCRRLNAAHGKTYYLATMLLPPAKRPYVHALYGFARHVDDIVDELGSGSIERADRFAAWSEDFLADLEWGATSDPVRRAVLDTIRRWELPHRHFADFLTAMAMDLDVDGYRTHADLAEYMWGSAGVIGLQMVPILGRAGDWVSEPELERHAVELGVAFQLTNFLRDVGEDLRRGRVYLPQDSLDRFDVDREMLRRSLAGGPADARIRRLLAAEVERTRELYGRAAAGVALVHPTSRDCLRTALTLYRGILDEIERADYDVVRRRVSVPRRRRVRVGLSGLAHAWAARRLAGAARPDGPATPRPTTSP